MAGAIGPPFLNAEPLRAAAQVNSMVNWRRSRASEGDRHRDERRITARAADDRQADRKAVDDLVKLASGERGAKEFIVTKYTVDEGVVENTVVEFPKHYLVFPEGGQDGSAEKKHTFLIRGANASSPVKHKSFTMDSAATKKKSTQNVVTNLMVDQNGIAQIQKG